MMDDSQKEIFLTEVSLDQSEKYLNFLRTGDPNSLNVDLSVAQKVELIKSGCAVAGNLFSFANSVVLLIENTQRIRTEHELIIKQLEGRIDISLEMIRAISKAIDEAQKIVQTMPNDYTDRDWMDKKIHLVNKMCDLSLEIARLV